MNRLLSLYTGNNPFCVNRFFDVNEWNVLAGNVGANFAVRGALNVPSATHRVVADNEDCMCSRNESAGVQWTANTPEGIERLAVHIGVASEKWIEAIESEIKRRDGDTRAGSSMSDSDL
jgi:hypothetical protein